MSEDRAPKKRCTAVILAGGSGSRMKCGVAKQFMLLGGKPLLWYSLQAVQQSKVIDDCILVTGTGDVADGSVQYPEMEYVRSKIVEKYNFTKVDTIVAGGLERCWSVENALAALRDTDEKMRIPNHDGYVFIHDSARPFLTEDILQRTYQAVQKYHACVAAVPSKDTVKIVDEQAFAVSTPDRSRVWTIQTPQVFDTALITKAYGRLAALYRSQPEGKPDAWGITDQWDQQGGRGLPPVTDDASVVERFTDVRVRLIEGSYQNIKITTPEDLKVAEAFLKDE